MKKILLSVVMGVLVVNSLIFASNMTALDYATISNEEWRSINEQNSVYESIAKESKKREAKQKNQDRLTGPGAIETTGNYVVNADSTEYFPTTVPAENASEFIEVVDPKYGIVFKSKRHFKTNLGEFDLNSAEFVPFPTGLTSKYRFKLNVGKVNKKAKSYEFFLKAYDINGNFVTYSRAVIDPSTTINKDIIFDIYGENDAHIARIDFGLDTSGMTAEAIANYNLSTEYFQCANILAKINDPTLNYDEAKKQEILKEYNDRYPQYLANAKEDIKNNNDIYEVE